MTSRFSSILNLAQFSKRNSPLFVDRPSFSPPKEEQRILRMLFNSPYSGFQLPEEVSWTLPIIEAATDYQVRKIKIRHPYAYLTVRHGITKTRTDDQWHVDGFSVRFNHLPEANYLVASHTGTQFADQTFRFPDDFDPLKHNVHSFFSKRVSVVECGSSKAATNFWNMENNCQSFFHPD